MGIIEARRLTQKLASRAVALACTCVLLSGCQNGMDDLEAYVATINARPGIPIETLPSLLLETPYQYSSSARDDPFSAPGETGDEEAVVLGPPPVPPTREELEQYPLDALRMVGTLRTNGPRWALVRDPSGLVHRVAPGSYIGRNYGKVVRVDTTQMGIVEIIPGPSEWIEREAQLALFQ